jgi:phosphoesterase RecJ-like protein
VVWTSIPLEMRRGLGYEGDGDAGLVSFLLTADGTDISVVFVEQGDGAIDVGMRAAPGFDVAQLALRFGGGGHALAAGFRAPGPLEVLEKRVLAAVHEKVARQRASLADRDSQR